MYVALLATCPSVGWLRYGTSTMLVFSGIGNVHAVKDAFEELRNALDPWKTESNSKKDRWREDSSKALTEKYVRDYTAAGCYYHTSS